MINNDLFIQKISLREDIDKTLFESYPLNINALKTFFFRAESFHEISSVLDKDDWIIKSNYSSKDLLKESHGESFMDLIEHQFIRNSLYILDEPESFLFFTFYVIIICKILKLEGKVEEKVTQKKKHIVTREELERRKKERKKKIIIARAVLITACVLIIAILVAAVVGVGSLIRFLLTGKSTTTLYNIKTQILIDEAELSSLTEDSGIYTTDALGFSIKNGQISCFSLETRQYYKWNEYIPGDNEIIATAFKDGILVYRTGETVLYAYSKDGLIWERDFETGIYNLTSNVDAGIICVLVDDDEMASLVYVLSVDNAKDPEEDILVKKYSTNFAITAKVTDTGAVMAVNEILEVENESYSKLSLVDVSTGKAFYSNTFENELCPYIAFVGTTNVVISSSKSVYVLENLKGNSVSSAKLKTLVSLGDSENEVLAVATSDNCLAIATGTGENESKIRIYDLEENTNSLFYTEQNVIGIVNAVEDNSFIVYTESDIMLFDSVGSLIGNSNDKINIEKVFGEFNKNIIIFGEYGIGLVTFTEK